MKNKLLTAVMILAVGLVLSGCGKDPELTKFKGEIDAFCTQISEIDASINEIDSQSETASEDLLSNLDKLDDAFKVLGNITVPEEFSYIEEVADKASEHMTEAVALYHEAFSNNSYNEYTAEYAKEYYQRAYKYVNVIIDLLRGEKPDVEGVTISNESEPGNTPSTIPSTTPSTE